MGPHRQKIDVSSILDRIKTNVGILLGGSGIVMLLNFVTAMLNARALGPYGLGVMSLYQASALIMVGIFSFGTQQPVIRLGKQAVDDHDHQRLSAIASMGLLLDVVAAMVAGAVSLLIVTFLPQRIGVNEDMVVLARFYTIVVFLSGMNAANGILRLFNQFHYLSVVQVGGAFFLLVISIIFFFLRAPLDWYLVTFAVAYATTVQVQVALAIATLRKHGGRVQLQFGSVRRHGLGRQFLSYAWTTNLTGILNTLRVNGEPLLLGAFFGASTVGVYNVVRQVAGAFNKLAAAGSSAVFPEVAELAARGERCAARSLLTRLTLLGLGIGMVGVVGMIVFGKPVLAMAFGSQFVSGYWTLVLMGLVGTLTLSSASFGGFVQAFVSPVRVLQLYVVSFLLYASAAPVLIYQLGLLGAPVGQLIFTLALWLQCWTVLKSVLPTN